MPFQPNVNDRFQIDGIIYRSAEHPHAPGSPYSREGRHGIVYQLIAANREKKALKLWKPPYRELAKAGLSGGWDAAASLAGLAVCRRTILNPQQHKELLKRYPDLRYAALMPWIPGPTWMEIINVKTAFTPGQSFRFAAGLADISAGMEERGLAHCNLSAANLILSGLVNLEDDLPLSLVDVEQMYGPDFSVPAVLPGDQQGYAHRTGGAGLWSPAADRFAGAVLLAEILAWCDSRIRQAAENGSFFTPGELQRDCHRYRLLFQVLRERWGSNIAALFKRAWRSDLPDQCPAFGEWQLALPSQPQFVIGSVFDVTRETTLQNSIFLTDQVSVEELILAARVGEKQKDRETALKYYRQARALLQDGSGVAAELDDLIEQLESQGDGTPESEMKKKALPHVPDKTPIVPVFPPVLPSWSSPRLPKIRLSMALFAVALATGFILYLSKPFHGNAGTYRQNQASRLYHGADPNPPSLPLQKIAIPMAHVPGAPQFPCGLDDKGVCTAVSYSYWIGKTEVTYGQWQAVYQWAMNHDFRFVHAGQPGSVDSGRADHPVTSISWRDAMVWCNALTEYYNTRYDAKLEYAYWYDDTVVRAAPEDQMCDNVSVRPGAKGFRLPTSMEWELAARYIDGKHWTPGNYASGASRPYDNEATAEAVAWYGEATHAAGSKQPNALGIYDMSENVWEWCFDKFSGSGRVIRGGNWSSNNNSQPVGNYVIGNPAFSISFLGFRVLRTE